MKEQSLFIKFMTAFVVLGLFVICLKVTRFGENEMRKHAQHKKQANFPDYIYFTIENFIVIYDMDKGRMSVTNGIEVVLADLSEKEELVGKFIIYRDSDGIYTQALIDKNANFKGYETPAHKDILSLLAKKLLQEKYASLTSGYNNDAFNSMLTD